MEVYCRLKHNMHKKSTIYEENNNIKKSKP